MTITTSFSQQNPVDDRYLVPSCGELDEIAEVFEDGRLSGGGAILPEYERALSQWFGVRRAVAVNSGTSALHASLIAVGVRPGDEVLVPATATLPTAMPVLTCGAVPVIVDVQPGGLGLDAGDVAAKITDRTKAALTLPLWGYPHDSTEAAALLAQAGIPIVEDACQAHGTRTGGRYVGTGAAVSCFSTHDRKLLSTGEGGFVLTDDEELAERIDYYTHLGHLKGNSHGVNYKLAAPLAAIGLRRLRELPDQLDERRARAQELLEALTPDSPLSELSYGDGDAPNYYNLVLTSRSNSIEIASMLTKAGLPPDFVRYGYRPVHQQKLFADYPASAPNAEHLCGHTFQLPVHPGMSEHALQWVAHQLASIHKEPTT